MMLDIVIPERKIPARDWSKSRHVAFTSTP